MDENKSVVWLNIKADPENDVLRQKELHLEHLGLITHKAAEKRRQEAALEAATKATVSSGSVSPGLLPAGTPTQQDSQENSLSHELSNSTTLDAQHQQQNSVYGKRNSKSNLTSAASQEYTGTLKTVIKLNRNSSNANNLMASGSTSNTRKSGTNSQVNITKEQQQQNRRQPLKMTFQKGRGRGHGTTNNAERNHSDGKILDEDNYYTIQNEVINFSSLLCV